MATRGEIRWPPTGTSDGRPWGGSHGRHHEGAPVSNIRQTNSAEASGFGADEQAPNQRDPQHARAFPASGRTCRETETRLITRRSQVRILPPLFGRRPWKPGLLL